MALPSTYALQQSLPNRSLSARPRQLSLSEYQPLSFDREALESAYQQTLTLPAASSISSHSPNPSFGTSSGDQSTDPTRYSATTTSTLTHNLKRGDNPHSPILEEPSPNFAGIGAGHSLTPPSSPFHATGKLHQSANVQTSPPALPPRPNDVPESTYNPAVNEERMDVDEGGVGDGALSDAGSVGTIGMSANRRGKRRALPPIPTNVPIPEPPQWEPDVKTHIPTELTQPSVENAYAQLGAPPPGLPVRRVQPRRQASLNSRSNYDVRGGPVRQYSGNMGMHHQPSSNTATGSNIPASASSYTNGISSEPAAMAPVPTTPSRPRPPIEKEVALRSVDKIPIWSTHYLDPSLRTFGISNSLSSAASLAFAGLSSAERARANGGAGIPIDGVAKAAKEWTVPPDGRFSSEAGGIELGLGVVDSGEQGWGKDKGRKRARVEVVSKTGGIRLDLIEIDQNRQIELRVESKTGDILVLLPNTFTGPIHITTPSNPPTFLSVLSPQLSPPTNPYSSFYTTHLTPSSPSIQVTNGFMSNTRGELSKVTIVAGKGRVVLGYRESRDEEEAKGLGLVVGAQGTQKRKRWWRGGA